MCNASSAAVKSLNHTSTSAVQKLQHFANPKSQALGCSTMIWLLKGSTDGRVRSAHPDCLTLHSTAPIACQLLLTSPTGIAAAAADHTRKLHQQWQHGPCRRQGPIIWKQQHPTITTLCIPRSGHGIHTWQRDLVWWQPIGPI